LVPRKGRRNSAKLAQVAVTAAAATRTIELTLSRADPYNRVVLCGCNGLPRWRNWQTR
jgi:hypothetical protein